MNPNTVDIQPNGTERTILLISAIGCLIIGCVGLAFAVISASEAILLDGLFNLTYFATGLFTLRVARLVQKSDDEHFPYGYGFFEPLVNGVKGVLVLGVSLMALAGALEALFTGGRPISAGAAITYGVFASAACWSLALISRIGAKRTASPLVMADAENWLINAAISSAVLLAFVGIKLIAGTSLAFLAPYVDPSLVIAVVVLSISVPVRMAWRALMELLNRTPSPEIARESRQIVATCTEGLPVRELFVRVIQPGRTRMVLAHVVLPEDFEIEGLPQLDALRAKTQTALKAVHPATFLDMIFTADRVWGAPISPIEEASGGRSTGAGQNRGTPDSNRIS